MSTWTAEDHARLATLFEGRTELPQTHPHTLAMAPRYAGYKPDVREAPNGDTKACPDCGTTTQQVDPHRVFPCPTCNGTGRVPNVDAGPAAKRWLHVAPKYDPPAWAADYYDRAFAEACRVATALGVPAAYRPHEAYGALRVLEYPSAGHVLDPNAGSHDPICRHCHKLRGETRTDVCPALAEGAGTVEHKDYDLFTIVLWRSTPADLERSDAYEEGGMGVYPERLDTISPGLHIGEIGELVGLGAATPHRVPARPYVQKSLIYFAVPDHAAVLPWRESIHASVRDVPTVGAWIKEREARSRVKGYT